MSNIFADSYQVAVQALQRSLASLTHVVVNLDAEELPATVTGPVRRNVDALGTAWAEIKAELKAATEDIGRVRGDTTRSVEFRQEQIANRISEARSTVTARMTAAQNSADELVQMLERRLLPPRPEASDGAAQEGRIAGIKSDFKMVLDATGIGEVMDTARGFLETARADEQELELWVLASSGWIPLYLQSRGIGVDEQMRWTQVIVPEVLRRGDDERASLSRVLDHLTGRYGLRGSLTIMDTLIRSVLDDLSPESLQEAPW